MCDKKKKCCWNCKHLEKIRDLQCDVHGICFYESTAKKVFCPLYESPEILEIILPEQMPVAVAYETIQAFYQEHLKIKITVEVIK